MATATSTTTGKGTTKGIRVQKISPFLWFDHELEDAMNFYVATFDNSRVLSVSRDQVGVGGEKGRVFTATFELAGQEFMGLNAGPEFKFNEAISFFVSCETQEQVDALWKRLTSDGGEESQCGWLKDKFGLSWQIVPRALGEMLQDKDPAKAKRVMDAMLRMKKIDIAGLKRAYDQR
jgi:predicted 3-demethylubiquinone-9 3-methyltransferase (glyoxalase superfamily)